MFEKRSCYKSLRRDLVKVYIIDLTNPAPVKGAARFGADHVHAAAVPLRRGPAPRARFTDHPGAKTVSWFSVFFKRIE